MALLRNISSLSGDDAELVSRYQTTGDLAVVGALYERYMDLVYGVCLKYLKVPDDAQDSVMTIFEELVVKLRKHEVENFKPWLYTLAKNHCLMRLRSEKKVKKVDFDTDFVQSEDGLHLDSVLEKEADLQKLEACMGQLSQEQRTVIELFYLKGKSYHEISASTGIEWNQVRSFIQNGRRNLKICMEDQASKKWIENDIVTKK